MTPVEPSDDPRPSAAPLLAVCGVCGGAGASALSYLIGRFAAEHGDGHALVCDTGGTTGGLAAYAGIATPRTLPESAALLTGGVALDADAWTVARKASGGELRVIASLPRLRPAGGPASFAALLENLRREAGHTLVVVDCGTLQRGPDRLALRTASHIVWVLPGTARGAECAERLFDALPTSLAHRQLIVARRPPRDGPVGLRALTALAEHRHAPLVLFPDVPMEPGRALTSAEVSLQAILGFLAR